MEAPAEPNAIPLRTGGVDGSSARETWFRQWGDPMVRNVTTATLTPFLPDPDKATGAAVIVAPGGGFMWLSMGNEGWEVAEALRARGVAAFVLKYRLRPTPERLDDFKNSMDAMFAGAGARPPGAAPRLDDQVEDARAAFALVRARRVEWRIDPDRIGMMGFSAGAGTTMATLMQAGETRPAFIAPIYGGMGPVNVPADAPPMFVALAADDPLFAGQGFGLIESWRAARRPVEFHYYQNGGHGFGLGNPDRTSNIWFDSFMHWLDVNGFLSADRRER
jgi:acetyl esterase/lipase